MEEYYSVTMVEMKRYSVLKNVVDGLRNQLWVQVSTFDKYHKDCKA